MKVEQDVRYRVTWWSTHPDGHIHSNFHDHDDAAEANRDIEACKKIAHIRRIELDVIVQTKTNMVSYLHTGGAWALDLEAA